MNSFIRFFLCEKEFNKSIIVEQLTGHFYFYFFAFAKKKVLISCHNSFSSRHFNNLILKMTVALILSGFIEQGNKYLVSRFFQVIYLSVQVD